MTTDPPTGGAAPAPEAPGPNNALPVGTRIGDFEVTGIVGEGGFGIVYRAFDHTLHRNVALKEYMPNALARRRSDQGVTLRAPQYEATFKAGLKSFVNEARLLAQFDHPALVKVFRFWEANDTAYMVMPLYEGRTLKAVLRGSPPPDEAWLKAMLAPLLDALETLHGARCYHRDVAPDNILILDNGGPLLLDFGAARRIIGNMTQAVTVIIKPGYAPVEQYADDPAFTQGPWTDIYALAAVIRFAITGKPPATSVTRMVTDPVRPLAEIATGYSAEFLRALDRGLAVRPEDRPQSIAEFRELLGMQGYGLSQPMPSGMRPSPAVPAAPAIPAAPASVSMSTPTPDPGLATATRTAPMPAGTRPPPVVPAASAAPSMPEAPASVSPPTPVPAMDPGLATATMTTPLRAPPPASAAPAPAPTIASRPPPAAAPAGTNLPWLPIGIVVGALAAVIAGGYLLMQSLAPKPSGSGARIGMESVPIAPKRPADPSPPAVVPPQAGPGAAPGATAAVPVESPRTDAPPPGAAPATSPPTLPATAAVAPPPPVAAPTASPSVPSPVAAPAPPPPGTGAAAAAPPPAPTGRLVLDVKPWGEIVIDGRSRGPSPPLKNLALPEGKYRIEVRNPAGATVVREVEIRAGRSVTVAHAFK